MTSDEQKTPPEKIYTQQDVIREALREKNLGPNASPEEIREWAGWMFPTVPLHDGFDRDVERIRSGEHDPAANEGGA